MNQSEVLDVLERRAAVLRGHWLLSSGRHSDIYVQKFRLFEQPRLTQRFGEELAGLFRGAFDVVAAPAVGAIVLGFATALAAETRMVFAEREGGAMKFRRGFSFAPSERVLVVEDVLTTGGSAREVVALCKELGGNPVGVAALIDRSEERRAPRLGVPLRALLRLRADSWDPQECPLCRANRALEDPGSRRVR